MQSLEYLVLYSNQLTGEIPASLGNLDSLRGLYLGDNMLGGGIPPGLGDIPDINYISLGQNRLTGCIPPGLGIPKALFQLNLNNNGFVGEIPSELMDPPLEANRSDFRYNFLFASDPTLKAALDEAQVGGDWESFQYEVPRVEPAGDCGGYPNCYHSFAAAFAAAESPSPVFVGEGTYTEPLVIDDRFTVDVNWADDFGCDPPNGPVILAGPAG
jgi:hypothetical protein